MACSVDLQVLAYRSECRRREEEEEKRVDVGQEKGKRKEEGETDR